MRFILALLLSGCVPSTYEEAFEQAKNMGACLKIKCELPIDDCRLAVALCGP